MPMVRAHKDHYVVFNSLDSAPCAVGVDRDTALFFAECTPNDSSREGEASVQWWFAEFALPC